MQNTNMTIIKKSLHELVLKVKRGLSAYYLREEGEEVRFINISGIENGRVNTSTVSTFRVKDTDSLENTRIEPNDVIVSIMGPAFKAAIADESVRGCVISTNLIAFKLNEEILPEVVVEYLNSPKGQSKLKARSAGGIQTALNLKSLMEIKIPVPEKKTQKLVAEYFLLAKEHDELIAREKEARKNIDAGIIQNYMTG